MKITIDSNVYFMPISDHSTEDACDPRSSQWGRISYTYSKLHSTHSLTR